MMEEELGKEVRGVGEVHPLLLHVVRMGQNKRDNGLEPVPTFYNWKQEFHIHEDKTVRILNKVSNLDINERTGGMRDVPTDPRTDDRTIVTRITERNSIVFGGSREEINMIALQPKLESSKARRGEATISNVLGDRLTETSRDVRQLVEKLFVIKDTGNRVSGAMDLHDVSLQKSCTAGGRKVIMVSEFSLADDVIPVFRVYDRD